MAFQAKDGGWQSSTETSCSGDRIQTGYRVKRMRVSPHISPGGPVNINKCISEQAISLSMSMIPQLHAVLSGFWNHLAVQLAQSSLNHSDGYVTDRSLNAAKHMDVRELPSADDCTTCDPQGSGKCRFPRERESVFARLPQNSGSW